MIENRIIAPEQQLSRITATTTHREYEGYMREHYTDVEGWLVLLHLEIMTGKIRCNEDSYRLCSLIGREGAAIGFELFDGHQDFMDKTGNRRPFGSPLDLVRTGVHLARLHQQMLPMKEALRHEIAKVADPNLQDAVYGISLIERGSFPKSAVTIELISELQQRIDPDDHRPILLPNPALTNALAGIELGSFVTKSVTYQDLERDLVPQLQDAFVGVCDPASVFALNMHLYTPAPFYSLPLE